MTVIASGISFWYAFNAFQCHIIFENFLHGDYSCFFRVPKGGNLRIRTLVCVCEIKTRAHSTHRIKFNQMTSVQSATLSENERLCSRFEIEINIYNIISVFQI